MSLGHGASIVRNGLVMHLDAANVKSYPGSGVTWSDLTGNANTGTLNNLVAYDSANRGSLVFDGVDDYVQVTCKANTVRAYNSTTQLVVKLPTYSGGQRNIMSYRSAGTLYIGKGSGGIFAFYNTLSPSAGLTAGSIANNSVAHVVVCCDASNSLMSIYINGTLAGSAARTGWSTTYNSTLLLGGGDLEYMVGNFYSFSHYNRVLSSTEIQKNFDSIRGRFGI